MSRMACINEERFARVALPATARNQPDTAYKQSYLAACGYGAQGDRCGGILSPQEVYVPPRTVLIRLFGAETHWNGQWWSTPYELSLLMKAAGHEDFAAGRGTGGGLLHATLAVLLKEWSSSLEHFCVIETRAAFKAFYGPGGPVQTGSTGGRKAALIVDPVAGHQRPVRQLFLPGFRDYERGVSVLLAKGATDTELSVCIKRYRCTPMAFEV